MIALRIKHITCILFLVFFASAEAQTVAVLQYEGGGDWYGNPTSLPNLIAFCNENLGTAITSKPETVKADDIGIMQYPFLHMTGHGNVYFSPEAQSNLRNYLLAGGFLHIDDNYGMEQYLLGELKKLFPNKELQEIPADHALFSNAYNFENGLPKIHEHDGQRPLALGLFDHNRLMLLFTTESDLGDGWENQEVHNDPQPVRLQALKMGANIIKYAFEN